MFRSLQIVFFQLINREMDKKPIKSHLKCLKILQATLLILQLSSSILSPCSAHTFRRQRQLQAAPQKPLLALPAAQSQSQPSQQDNVVAEMQVICQSDAIVLMVNTNNPFNGMLYAKDAPGSSNCISEFHSSTNMTFKLPLKSCGTLSAEVDDGIEYFNTVVVQPHMRLMTNQGKGYHIRCKYQTRERTIANTHFNVSAAFLMQNGPQASTTPLLATASMPMCTMKIYRIDQDNVAESVRVGDKLVMVIEIDRQDMYGMRISNCVVRDGLNKAEQQLINDQGCPVDESIMPKFEYENNNTRAAVAFKAHKFPHTSSVYYQCNVRLCINNGGCEQINCLQDASTSGQTDANANQAIGNSTGAARLKRFVAGHNHHLVLSNQAGGDAQNQQQDYKQVDLDEPEQQTSDGLMLPRPSELRSAAPKARDNDMSFDVYSGLYVSDITDMSESNSGDPNARQVLPARRNGNSLVGLKEESSPSLGNKSPNVVSAENEPCLTVGKASLIIVFASLVSVALVLLIACQIGLAGANNEPNQMNFNRHNRSLSSSDDLTFTPSLSHHHHSQLSTSSSSGRDSHYRNGSRSYSPRIATNNGHHKSIPPLCHGLGVIY